MDGFDIYAVPVAAGTLAISPMPRSDHDVDAIAAWGAALVITMTQNHELDKVDMAALGAMLAQRGVAWAQVPVVDFGIPTEARDVWDDVSGRATVRLTKGERVLVHCMGGCGRSGMAALRLMIDAGEEGTEALARLRAVRPCAVETQAQLVWAIG